MPSAICGISSSRANSQTDRDRPRRIRVQGGGVPTGRLGWWDDILSVSYYIVSYVSYLTWSRTLPGAARLALALCVRHEFG